MHNRSKDMKDHEGRIRLNTPDSERFQPPQGASLGAGFACLIVDYPGGKQTGMRGRLPNASPPPRLSRSRVASEQSATSLLSFVTRLPTAFPPSDV